MVTTSGHALRNEGAPSEAMKHPTSAGVYASSAKATPLGLLLTRFQIKQSINTFKTETKDKAALSKQKPIGPAEREEAVCLRSFTTAKAETAACPWPPALGSQRQSLRQIQGRACL